MTPTTTITANPTAAADLRAFRVPSAISEDLAFALEVADGEVLAAVVKRHGIGIDAFTSRDVLQADQAPGFGDVPEILCVSMTFGPAGPELLLALPASLSRADGIEIAFRIAASGKAYTDHSAISVELSSGKELLLFGGWDRSGEAPDCFIFGHRYDLPMLAPANTTRH